MRRDKKNRNENYIVDIPSNIRRKILGSAKYKRIRDGFNITKKVKHSAFYDLMLKACLRKT